MKRKILLCLLSLLLVITVPMAAAARTSEKEDEGPVGRPSVYQVPIETPKPDVTPLAVPSPSPSPSPTPSPVTPNVGTISTPAPTVPPSTATLYPGTSLNGYALCHARPYHSTSISFPGSNAHSNRGGAEHPVWRRQWSYTGFYH